MIELNPDNTAVVVIDMQNDFAHPDGALYAEPSSDAIEPINSVIEEARENGVEVIFTRDIHPEDQFEDANYYDEFERWGEHVVEGSWGAKLVDDLDVAEEDRIISKNTYNAFSNPEFEEYLQNVGVENLVFVGTLANVCVMHTAAGAGFRDYRPVILEDAVGYITEEHREYALEHADWLFGDVVQMADLSFKEP